MLAASVFFHRSPSVNEHLSPLSATLTVQLGGNVRLKVQDCLSHGHGGFDDHRYLSLSVSGGQRVW